MVGSAIPSKRGAGGDMGKKESVKNGTVKKETMLIVAFIALIVGFLGGVIFTSFKLEKDERAHVPGMAGQPVQKKSPSVELMEKIQVLQDETAKNPDNAEAWIQLGNAYFDTDQFDESISAYQKSLALNPNNADVLTDMGVMFRRKGQSEKAVESFDKAIQIDPMHETALFNKGIVLIHDLNDPKGAVASWEKLLELNPMAMAPNQQPVMEMVKRIRETLEGRNKE
jgi:cytochrome c-type biogenesis protein CcmH/NrfG